MTVLSKIVALLAGLIPEFSQETKAAAMKKILATAGKDYLSAVEGKSLSRLALTRKHVEERARQITTSYNACQSQPHNPWETLYHELPTTFRQLGLPYPVQPE